ncbi:MAG TPA: EutN/CcmL family microcompartment protein [Firmicutes bacterium]|nr:EutN/CcmL family microcompartment protein [Bacillota bacterium]
MKIARVVGTVVCVQKEAALQGIKLMVMQPLDAALRADGPLYIAADGTGQAGRGDTVVVVHKGDAPLAFARDGVPVDASIIGIVDESSIQQLLMASAMEG